MAIALVGSVAPAFAQDSPVDDAYGGGGGSSVGSPSATSDTSQRLPFSGFDLGLIAAGGLLFVVAGIGLRRAVRTES